MKQSSPMLFYHALGFAITAWLLTPTPSAFADSYDITKFIRWDVTKEQLRRKVEKNGPETGFYYHAGHAFAKDKHTAGPFHQDSSGVGVAFFKEELAIDIDADKNDAKPTRSRHLQLSEQQFFDQGVTMSPPRKVVDKSLTDEGTHATSRAVVELSTNRLGADPTTGDFYTEAIIHIMGFAKIENLPLHDPETAYAESLAYGLMALTGTYKSTDIMLGTAPRKRLETRHVADSITATASDAGKATYSDPITLSIFDEVTGEVIAENDLWKEEWTAEGDSSITWTGMGLSIIGGLGSTASVSFETLSDWISNPFNGRASIVNGVFTATADLSGLNWIVNTSEGLTTAFLSAAELSPTFRFDIEANGLGSPVNDLLAVIHGDENGYADAYATVSVPSTLRLVSLGVLGMLGYSWRRRRRGQGGVRMSVNVNAEIAPS